MGQESSHRKRKSKEAPMRKSTIRLAVLGSFLVFTAGTVLAGHGGKLPFDGDVEKAQARAKFEGKAMAFYFTATW